jgi:hypothetical protein
VEGPFFTAPAPVYSLRGLDFYIAFLDEKAIGVINFFI